MMWAELEISFWAFIGGMVPALKADRVFIPIRNKHHFFLKKNDALTLL